MHKSTCGNYMFVQRVLQEGKTFFYFTVKLDSEVKVKKRFPQKDVRNRDIWECVDLMTPENQKIFEPIDEWLELIDRRGVTKFKTAWNKRIVIIAFSFEEIFRSVCFTQNAIERIFK